MGHGLAFDERPLVNEHDGIWESQKKVFLPPFSSDEKTSQKLIGCVKNRSGIDFGPAHLQLVFVLDGVKH